MTVARNVGYPLDVAGVRGEKRVRRIAEALATVGLDGFGERRPAELSGGQRQRVALARCLVMDTSLVLLDEPLANLDVHLRAAMQGEFAAFHRKTGATMIYVTHDQAEAMALADRIAVLDGGRVVQAAPPRLLYEEPASAMVAGFIGEGAVVPARVIAMAGAGRCRVALFGAEATVRCAAGTAEGPALLNLRPEGLALAADGAGIACRVRSAVYRGGAVALALVPAAGPDSVLTLILPPAGAPAPDSAVSVAIADGWVLPRG
jgi:iron(III) transport system ATP-binding protein